VKGINLSRCALGIGVATTILLGCGGLQPFGAPGISENAFQNYKPWHRAQIAPGLRRRVVGMPGYSVSSPLLYVVNVMTNSTVGDVTIYDAIVNNPNPIAIITKDLFEPQADCIDAKGTLYVTNQPASGPGWVSEYALGETNPFKIVTNGINTPAFCAIDSQGDLWVTNISIPDAAEYKRGASKPSATIKNGLNFPTGIAIDHAGNVYVVNGIGNNMPNVQVYPPGGKSPSRTITDGVTSPAGIAVDASGTLYVTNAIQCNVEEYLSGQSHPYRTITDDLSGPLAATIGKNRWLYVTNTGYVGCPNGPWPVILEFRPGSVKPSFREIRTGLQNPLGTAYYPPLLP
jgi:hypothetical protein